MNPFLTSLSVYLGSKLWSNQGGIFMPRRGENIRKRTDGRWEGRYVKLRNATGKAIYGSVYAKTYLEVKRKLTEINNQVQNNTLPTKNKKTLFRELLYLWLENNRIKLKPQTYADYNYMIESHIIPDVGSITITMIDAKFINALLLQKSINGRLDGKGGLSASYIKKISFIIIATLEFAVKENYCHPIKGDIIRPAKTKNELEILTISEQTTLENYVMPDIDERKLGVLLSLYIGLRIGEVCGLRWCDIDFETRTMHIRHTIERIKVVGAKVGEPKTKLVMCDVKTISSNRILPIPPNLFLLLLKFRGNDNDYILKGNSYEYTDPRTCQYSFHKYLSACKIRKVNYHALRHTFATRCIESGMDIKSLSEMLGHASANITLNTYVHSSLEHKRSQLETMTVYCGQ